MAYFGGIFFANMGGGGGQNHFQKSPVICEVAFASGIRCNSSSLVETCFTCKGAPVHA